MWMDTACFEGSAERTRAGLSLREHAVCSQGLDNLQLNDKWKNLVDMYKSGRTESRTGFVMTAEAKRDIELILHGDGAV